MARPVLVSAVRTASAKLLGSLAPMRAPELGAIVVRAAIERAACDPGEVNEVIMGQVIQAGSGQNPARQAALGAGIPASVGAFTVNKVCGSSLKAVVLAAQAIALEDANCIVAGGQESMTNGPYLLPKARQGYRMGHGELFDATVHDGLWCAFGDFHMGCTGDLISRRYEVSREQQDAWAARSHQRAAVAQESGAFNDEIVAVKVPQRGGSTLVFDRDETIRADTSREKLANLTPVFSANGTVTAGNAPGVNDGAAALMVMSQNEAVTRGIAPLARVVAYATSGIEPELVMMAPVEAVNIVLKKAGWDRDDVDLFELNEAFAVQSVAIIKELGIDAEKVNVNGGAVALGHPIGASGARILTTLLHALTQRDVEKGIAAMCMGGGNGVAVAVERMS